MGACLNNNMLHMDHLRVMDPPCMCIGSTLELDPRMTQFRHSVIIPVWVPLPGARAEMRRICAKASTEWEPCRITENGGMKDDDSSSSLCA